MEGLEISNLTVDFGNFKLDDITVNIRKGCITGLIGRNGSGKSTLIKTIMRQEHAISGQILYDGMKFSEHETEVLNSVACVFDTPQFNTTFKPKKVASLYRALYKDFDMQLYNELMAKFSLPHNLRIRKFSFGMQRKYCIILALCRHPKILILDEPTSGIDPYDRNEVVSILQDYLMDENNTVLFSTHITEDLDKIADYIVMMDGGKITLDEEKNTLLESYRIIQCAELTEELRKVAINPKRSMFGYTFLTRKTDLEGEGIQSKLPTIEELFVYLLGNNGGIEKYENWTI